MFSDKAYDSIKIEFLELKFIRTLKNSQNCY